MKCHYTFDKQIGKILIPGCWSVVWSGDKRDCTCTPYSEENFGKFEKAMYNVNLSERNKVIKELEAENAFLRKDLERLSTELHRMKFAKKLTQTQPTKTEI